MKLTAEEKALIRELNEMYGTDVPIPDSIDLDLDAVQFDMAMGSSFDDAVQRNLEVVM